MKTIRSRFVIGAVLTLAAAAPACDNGDDGGAASTASTGTSGAGGASGCPADSELTCTIEVVDTEGRSGHESSLAVDTQGNAHVCYVTTTDTASELRYANRLSGTWTSEKIIDGGAHATIAVEPAGTVHLTYTFYAPSNSVTLIHSDNASGTWTTEQVDDDLQYADTVSMALDDAGTVHVGYTRPGTGLDNDLWYAARVSGAWARTKVDTGQNAFSAVAADMSGNAHLSYRHFDGTDSFMKYATNASGTWTTENIDLPENLIGYTTIAVDLNGKAHVSYYNLSADLFYATNASGSWVIEKVESDGSSPAIALDSNQQPRIAYRGGTPCSDDGVKYAEKVSGSWVIHTVDSFEYQPMATAPRTALALASDKPFISYLKNGVEDLELASCQ